MHLAARGFLLLLLSQDTMIDEDGAVQQLIECLHLMAADVDTLLRLPFDIFWSHVLYDTSVLSVRFRCWYRWTFFYCLTGFFASVC
jgi:hypothetical protein